MKKNGKNRITVILTLVTALMVAVALLMSGCSAARKDSDLHSHSYVGDNEQNGSPSQPGESLSAELTGENAGQEQKDPAKIIKEVTVFAETKDFDNALQSIKDGVKKAGGYVEKSSVNDNRIDYRSDRDRYASMVLRIPSEKLEEFLSGIGGGINVYYRSEEAIDVTDTYYDVQSRLETLKAKKDALQEMLNKAENLDSLLTIQERLYAAIAEIESYQTRLNAMDDKVAYSTVELTLYDVDEFSVSGNRPFGERAADAFKGGWAAFGKFVSSLAVWFLAALPFLLTAAVLVTAIVLIARASTKRNRKKNVQSEKVD
jgi:hypothetical protein